jgi:hypothetical protein
VGVVRHELLVRIEALEARIGISRAQVDEVAVFDLPADWRTRGPPQ